MLFNSLNFLFFFLPCVLVLFYLLPVRLRLALLCAASLYFYSRTGMKPMYGLVLSIGVAWTLAFLTHRACSRLWLALAIGFPLTLLFCAKYLTFALVTVPASLGIPINPADIPAVLQLALPPGISFYTFQLISYSTDVYDRRLPTERDPLLFATYISFFPQLIAGPILRFDQIRQQLLDLSQGLLTPDFPRGIKYLCIGLFAKIMAADLIATFCEPVVKLAKAGQSAVSGLDGLYYVLGYTFRIYFDFWSYSLMAIGLGLFFGLRLPRNFAEPYLSPNPQQFWRRWHITLSYWLRDYVYIKLGGNKHYVRNILIVFLACGMWHGAGYGFILWGAYHALLVLAYRFTRPAWDRLPAPLAVTLTFVLVALGWPLFDLGVSGYASLIASVRLSAPILVSTTAWLLLGIVGLAVFLGREDRWLYNETSVRLFDSPVLHAGLLWCAILFLGYGKTFIYFQF